MCEDKRKSRQPKGVYRVKNRSEYNAGLIARGSLTMWVDESALTSGSEAKPVARGRPQVCSDILIQALLTLRYYEGSKGEAGGVKRKSSSVFFVGAHK
jgi:hypothetical protein